MSDVEPMSGEKLKEIRVRLFAGAELPGMPWKISGHRDYPQRITNDRAVLIAECYDEPTKQRTTAEFIAHAPTDIEDLLAVSRCSPSPSTYTARGTAITTS